jgi:hypothetical protein
LLLSILRNNGLAAAEVGGYVNILPDAAIRQLPLRLVQRDDPEIPDDAWVSRVITVPDGRAEWLVPILRPLLPQAGHLAAPNRVGRPAPDRCQLRQGQAHHRAGRSAHQLMAARRGACRSRGW